MARIDRARLDAANLPVSVEIATRFDDLDMQGHVNNAAAVLLLQEARVHFNRSAGPAPTSTSAWTAAPLADRAGAFARD